MIFAADVLLGDPGTHGLQSEDNPLALHWVTNKLKWIDFFKQIKMNLLTVMREEKKWENLQRGSLVDCFKCFAFDFFKILTSTWHMIGVTPTESACVRVASLKHKTIYYKQNATGNTAGHGGCPPAGDIVARWHSSEVEHPGSSKWLLKFQHWKQRFICPTPKVHNQHSIMLCINPIIQTILSSI